jgi:maltose O-acetyltransferase
LEFAKPIVVGDNVWVGASVVVLPGVEIGSNVTIGAGSVVTRSIPANCVAVGNPCRVLRQLA